MLSPEQRRQREFKVTASVAPVVMSGDEAQLLALWKQTIGAVEPPDLSEEWPPCLGSYLETFILDWHERKTQWPLTERGRVVQHPTLNWCCCTLDAYRDHDDCTLDVKVCNGWRQLDEIISYYTPQALVQQACRQTTRCALLIMHGTAEPREFEIYADATYLAELWTRMTSFALCCEAFIPPVPVPKIVPPEQWRTVRLDTTEEKPNWGHQAIPHLQAWSRTKQTADLHAQAADEIKALLPDDVGRLRYFDVEVRRDRRGYLSIRKGPAA